MDSATIERIVRKVLSQYGRQQGESCSFAQERTLPVEISARHVHLSEQHALELFGKPLEMVRELSQPGQYLSTERLRLIGPKGVLDNVAVLGPARNDSQVEISMTDARMLGIKAPVRQSGDIEGTPGIVLASHNTIVAIEEGVIIAARHIHMSPDDAGYFGVKDRQKVSVYLQGQRPVVLRDVLVRVNENFRLTLHIDADEANGCGCDGGTVATIFQEEKELSYAAGC